MPGNRIFRACGVARCDATFVSSTLWTTVPAVIPFDVKGYVNESGKVRVLRVLDGRAGLEPATVVNTDCLRDDTLASTETRNSGPVRSKSLPVARSIDRNGGCI